MSLRTKSHESGVNDGRCVNLSTPSESPVLPENISKLVMTHPQPLHEVSFIEQDLLSLLLILLLLLLWGGVGGGQQRRQEANDATQEIRICIKPADNSDRNQSVTHKVNRVLRSNNTILANVHLLRELKIFSLRTDVMMSAERWQEQPEIGLIKRRHSYCLGVLSLYVIKTGTQLSDWPASKFWDQITTKHRITMCRAESKQTETTCLWALFRLTFHSDVPESPRWHTLTTSATTSI